MTEHRERLEKALRACAEARVPDMADPWPAIRERAAKPRHSRRIRIVPRTRAGWAFATLVALFIVSTGAYATGGVMDILDSIFEETVPYVQEHKLGTPVNEKQSREGVTVTIDRVYADSYYVVVGYHIEGLDSLGERPNDLVAELRLSEPGDATSNNKFAIVDSFQRQWGEGAPEPAPSPGSEIGTFVFEAPERLKAGEKHLFRVRVAIFRPMESYGEPVVQPFYFDLRVPVREAQVIDVNHTIEANGVPITLTRVINSPVRTNAYLCFDPPDDEYDLPMVKTSPFERAFQASTSVHYFRLPDASGAVEEGCATFSYRETLYDKPGMHSLTVTELRPSDPYTTGIKGPWRFSFEVPER